MPDRLKAAESAQSFHLVVICAPLAGVLYWLWGRGRLAASEGAIAPLEDMAALGDVVPDTIHPVITAPSRIGSGACVRACPEKNVLGVVHGQARF